MNPPPKLRFTLINNLAEDEVKKSNYVVYALECPEGVYVGMSSDPVKRWQEHCADAFNKDSLHYNDELKAAIRKCGNTFAHYIVAVASTEAAARSKEAAAIEYYGNRLNMIVETIRSGRDYGFSPIGKQIGRTVFLEKKGTTGAWHPRNDSQRKTVIAEIYMSGGKKRLRTINGQPFRAGLNIECSESERAKFNVGDKVRVNVAMSEKRGTEYLVAAKTASLVLVK
jgi:hypothetical protein